MAGKAFKGKTEAKKITKVKRKLKVRKGKKVRITANVVAKGSKLLTYAKKLRYFVEDKTIAKVTSKGVVKGLKKGVTKVWLMTVNGVRKAIKVTVR